MRRSQNTSFTKNERAVLALMGEAEAKLSISEILAAVDRPMNEATVYRILARFEAAGFAAVNWRLPDNDGRPVREYRLTRTGRTAERYPTRPGRI